MAVGSYRLVVGLWVGRGAGSSPNFVCSFLVIMGGHLNTHILPSWIMGFGRKNKINLAKRVLNI